MITHPIRTSNAPAHEGAMHPSPSSPPYFGKYWIRRPLLGRFFQAIDTALRLVTSRRKSPSKIPPPARILLANGGHIGDVLCATAVIPLLKKAFPNASIGMLIGSWSRAVVQDQPMIGAIHCVDHWKLQRGNLSLWHKVQRYRQTRAQALREISSRRYDVAVDLYCFFPNNIPLLWQAGIPVRIGYTSGGFGPLLTHPVDWKNEPKHVIEYHAALLSAVVGDENLPSLRPHMRPLAPMSLSSPKFDLPNRYLVIHTGTGAAFKEWPVESWRMLATRLSRAGHSLVFTGKGEREKSHVMDISRGLPRCIDLCDRLSWRELAAVIRGAEALIGADSAAVHLAASLHTPTVTMGVGINNPHHWRPWQSEQRVLTHSVPCSPCFRASGCPEMRCLRNIHVDEALSAIEALLANRRVAAAS